MSLVVRAFAVWLVILGAAVANGVVREAWLVPSLGPNSAHVVSTIVLAVSIVVIAAFFAAWLGPTSARETVVVGVVWLLLTLGFEFGAGHYLLGAPWSRLLEDYNIAAGRIWILVLVVTAFTPWALYRRTH